MSRRQTMPARADNVTIDSATRAVVATLQAEQSTLVAAMLTRLAEEIAEFDVAVRPELADPVRRSCVANLTAALAVVTGDRAPPDTLPTETLAETRVAIWTGITMSALAQNYRVCHSVLWEQYMVVAEESGFPPDVATGVLRHGWRCLFAYSDRVVRLASEEYERERERALHSSDERRAAYVREVLRGGWVDPEQLGYDLERCHLAVIASGVDTEKSLKLLSRTLECSLLAVEVDDELQRWAWLGRPSSHGQVLAAARQVTEAEQVRLAFGTPLSGPEGFRESKRQAELAARVGQRTGEPLTFYADVALEALALADEPAARRFMERELGELATPSPRTTILRTTLLAYLEAAQNASSAAAALGVHDRTVSYRLRGIAEALGAPIAVRSAELSLALRIHRVLDS